MSARKCTNKLINVEQQEKMSVKRPLSCIWNTKFEFIVQRISLHPIHVYELIQVV